MTGLGNKSATYYLSDLHILIKECSAPSALCFVTGDLSVLEVSPVVISVAVGSVSACPYGRNYLYVSIMPEPPA